MTSHHWCHERLDGTSRVCVPTEERVELVRNSRRRGDWLGANLLHRPSQSGLMPGPESHRLDLRDVEGLPALRAGPTRLIVRCTRCTVAPVPWVPWVPGKIPL